MIEETNVATRVVKNSFFLYLTTVMDRLAELALFFFMARSLGPAFVGDYKTVVMYLLIFQNLANYGLTQLVMREVAVLRNRQETSALLMNYGFASLWIALGLMALMNVTGRLIFYSGEVTLGIYLVSLALLPSAWRRVAESTISGMQSMEYITIVSSLGSVFRLVLSALLLWRGGGLMAILAVLVITQFAVIPAYIYVINRFLAPVRLRPDFSYVRRMAKQIGIFLVMGILLAGVGNQLAVVMIRKMTTAEQAGLYTAAYTFVQTIILLRPAILQAVFPSMSVLFRNSLPKFQTLTEDLLQIFMIALLPIPLLTIILAKPLMPLLLGESFVDSAITLQVLIWLILPAFIHGTLSPALVAGNQERANTWIAGFSMVVNILLNLAFIPIWGATGSALASVLAMTFAAAYSYVVVVARLFPLRWREILGKPLLCAAGASLAAYITGRITPVRYVSLWASILVLCAIYVLLLFCTKAIPPRLIELLKLFGKRWRSARGRHEEAKVT